MVTKEIATLEVNKWLDYKKVSEKKRESYRDNIESLIDSISSGVIVLNDDMTLSQELLFPIEGEIKISNLVFKPRIKVGTIQQHLQGVKSNDVDGRLTAYIAALTSSPKEIIKSLDTEDISTAQNIAIFFL